VNGSKYQKKCKDKDNNRVCRENMKGTTESRSNIEESLGRDKVARR